MKTISETISNCPLFDHLDNDAKSEIASTAALAQYKDGECVVEEGQPVDALYLVVSGEVNVSTNAMGKDLDLSILSAGKYFGEVSLMSGKNATANVESKGDSELVVIPKATITDLLKNDAVLKKLLEGMTLERAKDTLGKVLK